MQCSALKQMSFHIHLLFPVSCVCETDFPAAASLKTKYRSQLNAQCKLTQSVDFEYNNLRKALPCKTVSKKILIYAILNN